MTIQAYFSPSFSWLDGWKSQLKSPPKTSSNQLAKFALAVVSDPALGSSYTQRNSFRPSIQSDIIAPVYGSSKHLKKFSEKWRDGPLRAHWRFFCPHPAHIPTDGSICILEFALSWRWLCFCFSSCLHWSKDTSSIRRNIWITVNLVWS